MVHNDIKLDNILLGYGEKLPKDCSTGNCFKDVTVNLIDFGATTSYIDAKTGKHQSPKDLEHFRGNLLFSSPN